MKDNIVEIWSVGTGVRLEDLEKYIYDRDFKLLFTEDEFRMLMNIAQMKKTKQKTNLATEGEKIDKVYYLATVPAYKTIVLKAKDITISYIKEGAWLGIIEFNLHLSKAEMTNGPNEENPKWLVDLSLEKDDVEIVYYEWDFVSLVNLFKFSMDYKFINKILILWSKYLSNTISRLDDHIVHALKAMIEHDLNSKQKSDPFTRYISNIQKQMDYWNQIHTRKEYNLNKVGMDISEIK